MAPSTGIFDVAGELLATLPIRGRPAERKVIGAQVAALAQGRGGVLVIEGPPGIGKSRLLTEVSTLAEKSGVRTLFGEAFEYQRTVPFFSLFMATLHATPPGGATNPDVAKQLQLSVHTVKTHVHNAFVKLGVTSRAQLMQLVRGGDSSGAAISSNDKGGCLE